jgi:hypothetical protein
MNIEIRNPKNSQDTETAMWEKATISKLMRSNNTTEEAIRQALTELKDMGLINKEDLYSDYNKNPIKNCLKEALKREININTTCLIQFFGMSNYITLDNANRLQFKNVKTYISHFGLKKEDTDKIIYEMCNFILDKKQFRGCGALALRIAEEFDLDPNTLKRAVIRTYQNHIEDFPKLGISLGEKDFPKFLEKYYGIISEYEAHKATSLTALTISTLRKYLKKIAVYTSLGTFLFVSNAMINKELSSFKYQTGKITTKEIIAKTVDGKKDMAGINSVFWSRIKNPNTPLSFKLALMKSIINYEGELLNVDSLATFATDNKYPLPLRMEAVKQIGIYDKAYPYYYGNFNKLFYNLACNSKTEPIALLSLKTMMNNLSSSTADKIIKDLLLIQRNSKFKSVRKLAGKYMLDAKIRYFGG